MDRIEEMERRKAVIRKGGGDKRIQREHDKGKLTARERIGLLLDDNSFVEMDMFVEHRCPDFGMENMEIPGEGVVTGYGTVEGRLIYVYAQDATVLGGSLGEMHAQKISKVQNMAVKNGCPIVGLNDSGGARIQEGIGSLTGYGSIFYNNIVSSGVIPQISAIMGSCAGGAAYSPALTDFVIMVDKTSEMFITGSKVIKQVTGEDISTQNLGGARVHNQKSGVAQLMAKDEYECIEYIKNLLSYLPANNLETPPQRICSDDINRENIVLNDFLPDSLNKAYDMKEVIREIVDDGQMLEIQPMFAMNIITSLARLNGRSVGIIANQPTQMAGCIDINASNKASRFIRMCDSFNIPLVTLVDVPGYLPGVYQEHNGIIKNGAKLLYSYVEATVPKVTMILRKAYGGSYMAMCGKELGADFVFAWPTAEVAVMGSKGAADIVFRKDIDKSDNPEETRQEKIKEYTDRFSNPYQAAGRGIIDDVIVPSASRKMLVSALETLKSKREDRPKRKHGNIPM